ncbi:glycosyltransferase involved in cell wall biosynthesis [Saonia flava]|uniref:Glycosyltransferase involved in cell wall biosynthesis n=1 Tax=Saonia flava TaxID=523696 RepID=A0A846R0F5_9FLAO|nr:glycosyltransferase family 4 protein [Saonia flava]NJB72640.1 glycosyltransferase involved in cell wall biosynthesis [Saonia flava]
MNVKKISIIEPIGAYGGMDYYDYGLSYGLGQNKLAVLYFTCANIQDRDFKNVILFKSFGDVWSTKGFMRGFIFLKGYFTSFLISKKQKSDIFHFHFFSLGILNLIVLLMASLFKQKKVVTLHDIDPFYGNSIGLIEKLSLRLVNGVIVHNQASKEELLSKGVKLPDLAIIPHGNYLPFVEILPRPERSKTINILFFGQIKEVKGLEVLLNAMKIVVEENKNYRLTIVGRPWKTDGAMYERMILDLDLSDFVERHFRFIKDEEVASFYKNAHVVVLPYKKIYQSGVLLLTLSYGRTVITSNLEPFREIITDNENGFIFESENSKDLASCILKLNYNSIIETTSNSKKLIEKNFNWINIGHKTLNFYSSL